MRHLLLYLALPVILATIVSCASSDKKGLIPTPEQEITVETALANAPEIVDSIVAVTGECVHICDYSSYTAYLMGADSSLIRCVATANIGGHFPTNLEGKKVVMEGMFRDQHLNIEGVHNLDEQYRMHMQILRDLNLDNDSLMLDSHRRCEYERRYRGQQGVVLFDESTSQYRKSIEKRIATEGKDFLTFYYIEVVGFKILEDND